MGARHYRNVAVTVGGGAFYCYEKAVFPYLARVAFEARDVLIGFSYYLDGIDSLEKA